MTREPAPEAAQAPAARSARVSVGVPVYDAEDYLPQALDALLAQTFRDFEIVISDNGSTDSTPAICREYAARDPRVRVHREQVNRGSIWNWNRVLELAGGEYFKWAASDDLVLPEFLERCVAVMEADPTVVLCHSRTAKIDARGRRLPLPDPTLTSRRGGSDRPWLRFLDVLLSEAYGTRCSGVVRTASLKRARRLLPIYGSEKVLMSELALHGRFHDVGEVLFLERIHPRASGNLATAREQQRFIDPTREPGGSLAQRYALLKGHVAAVFRSPVGPLQRALCLVGIVRYLFQIGKWPRVASDLAQGRGTGGRQEEELRGAMGADGR